MLALTRYEGQRVIMTTPQGDRITVEVLYLRKGGVRLGFVAPADVRIDREEIHHLRESQKEGTT